MFQACAIVLRTSARYLQLQAQKEVANTDLVKRDVDDAWIPPSVSESFLLPGLKGGRRALATRRPPSCIVVGY
jgi:hypothetical protein